MCVRVKRTAVYQPGSHEAGEQPRKGKLQHYETGVCFCFHNSWPNCDGEEKLKRMLNKYFRVSQHQAEMLTVFEVAAS